MRHFIFIFLCFSLLFQASSLLADSYDLNLQVGAYNRVDDDSSYLVFAFKPYMRYDRFYLLLDMEFAFDEDGSLKQDDWDNTRSILEKISSFGYGTEDDKIFFRFGLLESVTLGKGILVEGFRNDVYYPQIKKLGLYAQADLKYFGVRAFVEDSFDLDFAGARVFVRPLVTLNRFPGPFKEAEFAFTYVIDNDPLDQDTDENGEPVVAKDSSLSKTVSAYAFDILIPIFKSENFNIDNFIQYGKLKDAGSAFSYGFSGEIFKHFSYQLEVIYVWDGFIPSYFSSFYEVKETRANQFEDALQSPKGWAYSIGIDGHFYQKQLKFGAKFRNAPGEGSFFRIYGLLKPAVFGGRVYAKYSYERQEISSADEAFDVAQDLNNVIMIFEVGYNITHNATIGVRYLSVFKEEAGDVSKNSVTEIRTGLMF